MESKQLVGERKNGKSTLTVTSNLEEVNKDNFIDRIAFVFSKTCTTTDCQQITRAKNDKLEHIDN